MSLDKWHYYYKIDPAENQLTRHNMLYTPLVNLEGNVMCMAWDAKNFYQTQFGPRSDYTQELVDFFFQRELTYLGIFKNYAWSPEILEIDLGNKRIFYKWYGETCNNIIYNSQRNLDSECKNWSEQLASIIKDIYNAGYMKMSLYPHCHYLDKENKLHTIDFYGCASRNDPYIEISKLYGMIGPKSNQRFDESTTDGIVNLEFFFKRAMTHFIKWPGDPLPRIYDNLVS